MSAVGSVSVFMVGVGIHNLYACVGEKMHVVSVMQTGVTCTSLANYTA